MEMRTLGRTGEKVSAYGFGGIVVKDTPQKEANLIVAEAIAAGINYFDVAPGYGNAQDHLGPALKPYRKNVMLTCKTGVRDAKGARAEMEDSLKKLETDYFDVYQLHGIDDPAEIDQALAPGGALEAVLAAQREGLVRFVGFSCHKPEAALQLMSAFDFDTVLFPLNWTYWLAKDVGPQVIQAAQEKNRGIIAMKALAHRHWAESEERSYPKCWYKPIFDDDKLATLALRFILSQPVSVVLSSGDVRMFRLGLSIVQGENGFQPLNECELEELTSIAKANTQFMW